MSSEGLRQARVKMAAAGVSQEAIDVFAHYYAQLEEGATGLISEADISPLPPPTRLADVHVEESAARGALDRTVVIKLNGGLGTSMGMDKAKSLLEVREGRTFIDLICEQVRHARATYGARLPLLFMNSFRTSHDTLAAMAAHPDLATEGLPLDFLQSQEPKLLTSDLTPVTWEQEPALEWCPPGHGDLYPALLATGILRRLQDLGYRYATVSNSDNLGATPDPRLAGWFASGGRRTPSRCAAAPPPTAKAGIWRCAGQTGESSCGSRPRPTRPTWMISRTRRGTAFSTPTACGSTWSRSRRSWRHAEVCSVCR